MKSKWMIFIIILILISCSDKPMKEKDNADLEKTKVVEIKEENPPLKTCSIQLGDFEMGVDGYSLGKETELTELLKQLKNMECDIIEISYGWTGLSSGYAPAKIIYNRHTKRLQQIYVETNVIEDYQNVDENCLKDFLEKGHKSLWELESYCENITYDFNNREMKQSAIGPKPEQSTLDGSVLIVKSYVKSNAKDATSIEFIEWSKVTSFGEDWVVRCKFKGSNSFGSVVTQNVWFYIQDNKIVNTKIIE
ncbi:MAG: hypothetical protein P9L97_03325 [Candidatus Tenebribacter davisii]|jgi:hypothetical protein|nr:hypothetical protein [Candidatus Tenebribacter davisii]